MNDARRKKKTYTNSYIMKLKMEDNMKDTIIKKLNEHYTLEKRDMGDLANIHKGMFQFDSEAYEIQGVGNLFLMDMKAMLLPIKCVSRVLNANLPTPIISSSC